MKDQNLTANVAQAERKQKCEVCGRLVKQSELKPRKRVFVTKLACRDCFNEYSV